MSKKKSSKEELDNGTLGQPEVNEQIPTDDHQQNTGESLEDDFMKFEKNKSEFIPEQEENPEGEPSPEDAVVNNLATQMKIKMFVGFCCLLLAGFNNFVLNKIKKTNVPFDDMKLTDAEQESIMPYMDAPEVIAFIDKIPVGLIAVIHIEYMFIQKHNAVSSDYKIQPEIKVVKDEEVKAEKK